MAHADEIKQALQGIEAAEQSIAEFRAFQRARLAQYVNLDANMQAFWYTSDDDGMIKTKFDAPFMCLAIIVSGNPRDNDNGSPPRAYEVQLRNLNGPRDFTNGQSTDLDSTADRVFASTTIPIEAFVPAPRRLDSANAGNVYPYNVDYWYTLPATEMIPRGNVIQARWTPRDVVDEDVDVTPPNVTLFGYKVFR
jgi:hypothetical protein